MPAKEIHPHSVDWWMPMLLLDRREPEKVIRCRVAWKRRLLRAAPCHVCGGRVHSDCLVPLPGAVCLGRCGRIFALILTDDRTGLRFTASEEARHARIVERLNRMRRRPPGRREPLAEHPSSQGKLPFP
jgi:hypothetical protein